ncbi:MAG: hypothetical protein CMG71_03405 [Candidatus Marinimicrobia bacterium]|nr:hypothetical protein [Candidatus Neomarinimicrobiota bacterium]
MYAEIIMVQKPMGCQFFVHSAERKNFQFFQVIGLSRDVPAVIAINFTGGKILIRSSDASSSLWEQSLFLSLMDLA